MPSTWACEQPTKYREAGSFVCKVFPNLDRLPDGELGRRIDANASKPINKKKWLIRSEFPQGSPGFLFLQARALMSGVERLPRELSVGAGDIRPVLGLRYIGLGHRFERRRLSNDLPLRGKAERASQYPRIRPDAECRFNYDYHHDVRVRVRVGDEGNTFDAQGRRPKEPRPVEAVLRPAPGQQIAKSKRIFGKSIQSSSALATPSTSGDTSKRMSAIAASTR